jgi:hypothetical protein
MLFTTPGRISSQRDMLKISQGAIYIYSQLSYMVSGYSHRGGPGSRPGSMWSLWRTKRHWGRVPPSTSVSPANHHSTNFSIIIIIRGWHNMPICGRSAEWTQLHSTLHYTNLKLIAGYQLHGWSSNPSKGENFSFLRGVQNSYKNLCCS